MMPYSREKCGAGSNNHGQKRNVLSETSSRAPCVTLKLVIRALHDVIFGSLSVSLEWRHMLLQRLSSPFSKLLD
jgi:hypothetical protein